MGQVFFVVGHRGSGKTFLANKLKNKYNVIHIDTGPLLRKNYRENFKDIEFGNWLSYGEEKFGTDFTNLVVCKEIEKEIGNNLTRPNTITIITGNRSLNGIEYIIEYFCISEFKVVFLDAPFGCLKDNYNEREGTFLTDEEFEEIIQLEKSMGIDEVKSYVMENPSTSYYLYRDNNSTFTLEDYENILQIDQECLIVSKGESFDEDIIGN